MLSLFVVTQVPAMGDESPQALPQQASSNSDAATPPSKNAPVDTASPKDSAEHSNSGSTSSSPAASISPATSTSKAGKNAKPAQTARVSAGSRFVSFGIGTLVGTPIAAVKRTMIEDEEGAKYLPVFGGKNASPKNRWIARTLVFPACLVGGVVESPIFGVQKSWEYSESQPFSKKCFCLGDLSD